MAGAVLGKYCCAVPASQASGWARGVKTSHSDCRLGQLIPGGFSFPAYSPNKAHKELVVSCLLFHSCGAGVELPAFGAGQLWQGSLALPAAGRENFLSHLRALLGGLHLVSHQTLWFGVWGPPAWADQEFLSCFQDQPPHKYFVPDHQYPERIVAQGRKGDIILKFLVSWLCLCFSPAFRDVLWVCVSFHTLVDLVRFAPPFFLMWGSHLV